MRPASCLALLALTTLPDVARAEPPRAPAAPAPAPRPPATSTTPRPPAAPLTLPPSRLPPAFQTSEEIVRVAQKQLATINKQLRPQPAPAPAPFEITLREQPAGAAIGVSQASTLHLDGTSRNATLTLPTVPERQIGSGGAFIDVAFDGRANTLYVIDCPLGGGPLGRYELRVGTQRIDSRPLVNRILVAHIATSDDRIGIRFQAVQPEQQDNLGDAWFTGCRITPTLYQ